MRSKLQFGSLPRRRCSGAQRQPGGLDARARRARRASSAPWPRAAAPSRPRGSSARACRCRASGPPRSEPRPDTTGAGSTPAAAAASRSATTRSSTGASPGASEDAAAGKRPCSSAAPSSSSARASMAAAAAMSSRDRAAGRAHRPRSSGRPRRRARPSSQRACAARPSGSDTTARCTRASYPCGVRPTPALAYRVSIAAACVAAAARLLPYLGDRVMHRDEALAVMVARRPLGELLETVQLVRGGAPLHFLLAKLVAELGGGLVATRASRSRGCCSRSWESACSGARSQAPSWARRRPGSSRSRPSRSTTATSRACTRCSWPSRPGAVVPRARARHERVALLGGCRRLPRPQHLHAPLRRGGRPGRRADGAGRAAAAARARRLAPAPVRGRGGDRGHGAARDRLPGARVAPGRGAATTRGVDSQAVAARRRGAGGSALRRRSAQRRPDRAVPGAVRRRWRSSGW